MYHLTVCIASKFFNCRFRSRGAGSAEDNLNLTDMKKQAGCIFVFLYLCFQGVPAWAGGTADTRLTAGNHEIVYGQCREDGGYERTVVIIPRVYIRYTGKDFCWSEIRDVEIPVDFLKLQYIAKEKGDSYTAGIMSHGYLVGFFTWLLESGRYAMPGDALFGILGYVQRYDYAGLYELYRSWGASRR